MFRIFRSIRLVLAAIVLIPMGLFMGYTAMFGSGHIVVVASEESPVTVSIDGAAEATVSPGAHSKFEVKQGRHKAKLSTREGSTEHGFDVSSGFADLLVPASDEQCFVVLDVSKSHYQFGGKESAKFPTITRRVAANDVYDLPGSTYYSEKELPRSIKENSSCHLLLEVDCEMIKLDDLKLLKTLGF